MKTESEIKDKIIELYKEFGGKVLQTSLTERSIT